MKQLGHWINGQHVAPASGSRLHAIFNPAAGAQSAQLGLASTAECAAAIAAAHAAWPVWSAMTPLNRARILFKFKALIEQHADELTALITAEHGKVLSDAKGELTRGLEIVEFACGIPHLLRGDFTAQVGADVDSYSLRQPVGVCAGITPFNFPAMVPMWMFPIAIACGNTFVLKPSERDPSCPMRLAELLKQAGLPDGVFNIINGDKEAVDTLLHDPRVAAISFVGSTPIAEYIYTEGAKYGKRTQPLGGAKNHMVILPDADRDMTLNALMGAAYGSAGERCMAISVAVMVADAAEKFIDPLAGRVRALKIGAGTDASVEMGPLVTREHRDKVRGYVDLGVQEGAKLIVDGRHLKVAGHEDGFFLGGCLFDHVTPQMRIYREEIFGPVLCIVRVNTLTDAIRLTNAHEFANGTAIFTRDGEAARRFTHAIEVGMVGVNVPIPVPMAFHSFGGWKRSLFGVQHMHGLDGVRFYTRLKTVTQRWAAPASGSGDAGGQRAAFIMPTMK